MQAAFRADASAAIGSGHLMRCLVLADALKRNGAASTFLCRLDPALPLDLIAAHGHAIRLLPPHADLAADAAATAAHLDSPDWLVVDHYALDSRWETPLRRAASRIMAIDDLANRPHDCDVLLDQNLLPEMHARYAALLPPSCLQLLGPAHALLRDEFAQAAAAPPRAPAALRRLLVAFGGSDPANATGRALREIADLPLPADVVIGRACPHRPQIENACRAAGNRWTLHVQTDQMARLMARCDLALGAGGTSHWERCAAGLPALVAAIADNQVPTTLALHERGACRYLGPAADLPDGAWRDAVRALLDDPAPLAPMSRAARAVVPRADAADRIAQLLIQKAAP